MGKVEFVGVVLALAGACMFLERWLIKKIWK